MRTFGGVLLMLGLGQAMYQIHVWTSYGVWVPFTLFDLWAEFGGSIPYIATPGLRQAVHLVGDLEMSALMLLAGAIIVIGGPVLQGIADYHAAQILKHARRDGNPLNSIERPIGF